MGHTPLAALAHDEEPRERAPDRHGLASCRDPGWPAVVWCLVGPTAAGKTALAIDLAARAPIEIVSADSRMVYRWMDIGTAKPDHATLRAVPHHLVDVVDPDEPFPVVAWVVLARRAIRRIAARGRQPLIVGGTGLYFRALMDGLDIPPVPPDDALRIELDALAARDGWQAVHALLREVDPVSAARIEGRNVRRVIRAIEVTRATGRPFSDWQRRTDPPFAARWAGLDMPVPNLDAAIARRVQEQFDAGLATEVQQLRDRGFGSTLPALQGLAYREARQLLDGEVTREEAVARYEASTRRYARRQRSWFRPDARIRWFDPRVTAASEVLAHFST